MIRQSMENVTPFVKVMAKAGIIPGLKIVEAVLIANNRN
jgi:fructose-bisphosphate aldolase class 1